MENIAAQQEILLVTTSTLSQRQWCEKETGENSLPLSAQEALEKACWNGMLQELIPEILVTSSSGKQLILWNIRQGKGSLQIGLSEFPLSKENHYSIDCHFFLPALPLN